MALHNLKIVVVDGGRSGGYKSKNAGLKDADGEKKNYKNTPLYKLLHAKETIKNKVQSGMTPRQSFALNMGLNVASQLVQQYANYYISDIGRKNGDSNYQAIVNRQIEIVSDVASIGSGLVQGAATGSMFGPVGAAIGAVLGVASSGISLGFKYADRTREYQHTMFQENTSQAYNLARANYSVSTGRVR